MQNLGLLFQQVAETYHGNDALAYDDGTILSYKTLNERSNDVARFLVSEQIGVSDVVVILNTKHPISFATMIACLKIGAIYCNIDEQTPPERLTRIIERCKPSLIISDQPMNQSALECLEHSGFRFIDSFAKNFAQLKHHVSPALPAIATDHNSPAYIMFTSGSTGFPKGATITHGNLLNFIKWAQQRFSITPSDRFSNVNPIYFDNSVFDFYSALFSGACLLPIPRSLAESPKEMVNFLTESGCSIWFSVPSMLVYLNTIKLLSTNMLISVRYIIFGGEGYPKSELKKLWDLYGSRATLVNVYGPTECTCICSSYDISETDFADMAQLSPLGVINPDFDYIILDQYGQKVETGNPGELCLLGPNVGKGYYHDCKRSDDVFVHYPDQTGSVMYKTGDLVFENSTGLLHFCGRKDNQIKHMGYRIELEEIEAALNAHPAVSQSGVIYKRISARGGRIFAFIVCPNTLEQQIRSYLSNIIPKYMMPHEIRFLEKLPKNSNGKVDRQQLQALIK